MRREDVGRAVPDWRRPGRAQPDRLAHSCAIRAAKGVAQRLIAGGKGTWPASRPLETARASVLHVGLCWAASQNSSARKKKKKKKRREGGREGGREVEGGRCRGGAGAGAGLCRFVTCA